MKTNLVAGFLILLVCSQATAQLPAQRGTAGSGNRPTTAPSGTKIQEEPEKASGTLTPKAGAGREVKSGVAIAQANFMIGVRGYGSKHGMVVMATMLRRDLDRGNRARCAVKEIKVDFRGNGKLINMYLEPGDVITSIDGFEVKNLDHLIIAVNSATNPHDMQITFIDWRTGNEYTGTIDAMKVR